MKNPCHNRLLRFSGCHGICSAYGRWRLEQEAIQKKRAIPRDADAFMAEKGLRGTQNPIRRRAVL